MGVFIALVIVGLIVWTFLSLMVFIPFGLDPEKVLKFPNKEKVKIAMIVLYIGSSISSIGWNKNNLDLNY